MSNTNALVTALQRQAPYFVELPEGFKVPAVVAKAAKDAEKAYSLWVDADTRLAEAEEALGSADREFAHKVIEAAEKNAEIPKKPDSDELETAILFYRERDRLAREAVADAVELLKSVLVENRLTVVAQAVEDAIAGREAYKASIAEVAERLNEIEMKRRKAYRGIVFVSWLTEPELRYVPEIGSGDDWHLPRTHESQASSIINALEGWLEHHVSSSMTTVVEDDNL